MESRRWTPAPAMRRSSSTNEHGRNKFSSHRFDPRFEFLQFLEEARETETSLDCRKQAGSVKPDEEERKKKKSWRKGLLSWWKSDQKKSREGDENCHLPRTGSFYGSGPVKASRRLPLSGPLSGLFNASRREEKEIPYASIHQQQHHSSSAVVHNYGYGPIYLVT